MIVGRQEGTKSKARLPDNVTLAKHLQLPHLEDEDNSICLRNILLSQPNDTKHKANCTRHSVTAQNTCSENSTTSLTPPSRLFLPLPLGLITPNSHGHPFPSHPLPCMEEIRRGVQELGAKLLLRPSRAPRWLRAVQPFTSSLGFKASVSPNEQGED